MNHPRNAPLHLHLSEDTMKRIARILLGIFALGLIILDGRKFMADLSLGATLKLLRTFSPLQLTGFFSVSVMAVWLTFLYDFTAVKRLHLPVPIFRIMKIAWIANSFNNIAGFGGLGGAGARMLLYPRTSINEKAVLQINLLIIPAAVTGLGFLMLLNLTGLTEAAVLIREYRWLPLLIMGFAAYIPFYCWFTDIRFTHFRLRLSHSPDWRETRTRLILTLVSALDWTAAALVLWFILWTVHPGITVLQTVGLFSIATAAGISSMIPGGLGSFDLMLLSGLRVYGVPSAEAFAVLVLFRFFYYVVPLIIGAVLSVGEVAPIFMGSITTILSTVMPPAPEMPEPRAESEDALIGELASKALSLLIFSGGFLLILSAAIPGLPGRISYLAEFLTMPVLQMSHRISLTIGLLMLLLTDEILLRLRRAWIACLLLLAFGAGFTFIKGMDVEEMLFLMLILFLLWLSKDVFQRLSVPVSPYRILRSLLLTAAAAGFYILAGQPHPLAFFMTHSGISMLNFTSGDYLVNGIGALGLSWICYALWLLTLEKPSP